MNRWVFGYGSLIWRPDFAFLQRRPAVVSGWSRRFWQGSHDHRGTPDAPGRVVTLVADPGTSCAGIAYLVDAQVLDEVFEQLDLREQNGYQRRTVQLHFSDQVEPSQSEGLVYIAAPNNPAFLGPASLPAMAAQIHASQGPSGHNRDYLLALAEALRDLDADDEHVFALETALRSHDDRLQ